MSYFCTLCNKLHSDQYKVHWKYKKELPDEESRVDWLVKRLAYVEEKCGLMIDILKSWKQFIDRKHPYVSYYQPFFEDL